MPHFRMVAALLALLCAPLFSALAAEPGHLAPLPLLVVHDEVLHDIDPRLFGHLVEKAGGREPGIEAALDAEGALRRDVRDKIEWLRPSVLRFPGGTIVEHMTWNEMIDDEEGNRPEGHAFGLHEFLDLAEEIGSQPLLVVPLREAIMRTKPVDQVAREAAGYVAYVNATHSPQRERNGRAGPWGVQLWQLGNESFDYINLAPEFVAEHGATAIFDYHVETINAVAAAMLEADPGIELIVDVELGCV